jgi:hypothetical protein
VKKTDAEGKPIQKPASWNYVVRRNAAITTWRSQRLDPARRLLTRALARWEHEIYTLDAARRNAAELLEDCLLRGAEDFARYLLTGDHPTAESPDHEVWYKRVQRCRRWVLPRLPKAQAAQLRRGRGHSPPKPTLRTILAKIRRASKK